MSSINISTSLTLLTSRFSSATSMIALPTTSWPYLSMILGNFCSSPLNKKSANSRVLTASARSCSVNCCSSTMTSCFFKKAGIGLSLFFLLTVVGVIVGSTLVAPALPVMSVRYLTVGCPSALLVTFGT